MTTTNKTPLGALVRERISGIEGVVIGRSEWLYGCATLTVKPTGSKEGKPHDTIHGDEQGFEVLKNEAEQIANTQDATKPGGPKDAPSRGPVAERGR